MKKTLLIGLILAFVLVVEIAKADFTFGTPTSLDSIVQSRSEEAGPTLSYDGLSLFFFSNRSGGYGRRDLWVTTRTSISNPWEPPVNLGSTINSSADETEPSISADGLSLYFSDGLWFGGSPRSDGFGQSDIWISNRATISDPWDAPINLGPNVNTSAKEGGPTTTSDGLVLIFNSDRSGGRSHDLWMATRPTVSDPWGTPTNLGTTVNSAAIDAEPSISPNGLVLFFMSNRTGGAYGDYKLWVTMRPSISDNFGTPIDLGSPINSSAIDATPSIAPDGFMLLFMTERATSHNAGDLWQVPIIPIVDFTGDGVVDDADLCVMVNHWGTDNSLCDIGPMPWGDGIVDVLDLVVLTEYIEPIDRTLIAHWELDEIEGDIAYDSSRGNDAIVLGDPVWQPEGGIISGALQFDGIDDYLSTPFILNPSEVSFSATAWIKGGVPGQVIISQADVEGQSAIESGSTWLGINPSDGRLMTGLMEIFFGPLESESVVADGQWHHVGLVYDLAAMKRHLYVDGEEVAVDAGIVAGVQSTAGLYIGSGQTLDAGSFFSDLIDDVRVYNQALGAEEIAALEQ